MPDEFEDGVAPAAHAGVLLPVEHEELPAASLAALEQELAADARDGMEDAAARSRRREIDGRIVEILRADGFTGPRYERVVDGLMEYGWTTMVKWNTTGEVFRRTRAVGRPVPEGKITTDWDRDDRLEIATDTVIDGLRLFHRYGLVGGRWSPDGGASLATYFVGATIRAFRPVYLRWFRTRQNGYAELEAAAAWSDETGSALSGVPDQRAADPFDMASLREQLRLLGLCISDERVREGLLLRAQGYTQAEAADLVGLSERGLEGRIRRVRRKYVVLERLEAGEWGAR